MPSAREGPTKARKSFVEDPAFLRSCRMFTSHQGLFSDTGTSPSISQHPLPIFKLKMEPLSWPSA